VPAAVNLSLPHTTSILLTRTKVYDYKDPSEVGYRTANNTVHHGQEMPRSLQQS